jgi:hypothetical protein
MMIMTIISSLLVVVLTSHHVISLFSSFLFVCFGYRKVDTKSAAVPLASYRRNGELHHHDASAPAVATVMIIISIMRILARPTSGRIAKSKVTAATCREGDGAAAASRPPLKGAARREKGARRPSPLPPTTPGRRCSFFFSFSFFFFGASARAATAAFSAAAAENDAGE